jgi:hypothetical protein
MSRPANPLSFPLVRRREDTLFCKRYDLPPEESLCGTEIKKAAMDYRGFSLIILKLFIQVRRPRNQSRLDCGRAVRVRRITYHWK